MRLPKIIQEVKEKTRLHANDLVIAFVIICVSLISFGLGRLSILENKKTPVKIESAPAAAGQLITQLSDKEYPMEINNKMFVASKNGTKYHFPWCSGAQRIKEENKIWFASKEEAEKSGYTPAVNCEGLK